MGAFKDLTGKRFGRLVVIGRDQNDKNGNARWTCICDCGRTSVSYGSQLRNGRTQSCGCLHRERVAQLSQHYRLTHGASSTRLYRSWRKMIERCVNEHCASYKYYGARGISVCAEWNDFTNFQEWAIHNGYSDELTIDRIDTEKGYSPDNCRWATITEQANNKRNNHFLAYDGETLTIAQWERRTGIPQHLILQRIDRDMWSVERALTTPVRRRRRK